MLRPSISAPRRPCRKTGTLALSLLFVGQVLAADPAADARERDRGFPAHRPQALTYCAYELGSRLTVEAINNRNQIAGTAALDGDLAQAFVWNQRHGVRLLGVAANGVISVGKDINDRGQVVGITGGTFIWDERRGMRVFETLGGQSRSVTHINNAGQIIGLSSTADEQSGEHLFLRERNGDVLDLGAGRVPFGLTGRGQVGFSEQSQQPPSSSEVFIWDPARGVRRVPGFAPGSLVLPSAINDRRHIVGSILGDDQLTHAVLWTPGQGVQRLTLPYEAGFSHATDINEHGTIVGYMDQGYPLVRPFVWHERSGLLDLTALLDPTSPAIPQAESIVARAINDHGWIAVNTGPRVGPDDRAYVFVPRPPRYGAACRARLPGSGN